MSVQEDQKPLMVILLSDDHQSITIIILQSALIQKFTIFDVLSNFFLKSKAFDFWPE